MPTGSEHVEAALAGIQVARDQINALEVVADGWQEEATARLDAAADLLRATMDRFYLKTRVSTPFARRCEEAISALDGLLAELSAEPDPGAQQRLSAALDALEAAARTLDERSQMRGMAIT
jgi:hypothetical protein